MSRWLGQPSIKGSSEAARMALLTLSTIGITFVWGVEQTYCTPYLLSLGLTKSKTSLVWIAGPLSGLIVQPIVGTIADKSTSRWGRRRPFIMIGAVISALCLLVLGFTEDIVGFFVPDKKSAQHLIVSAAVLSIYAVDFSINAVMSAARSLVVDTLPIEKQQTGSAWGSRMSAIGHGIAFATGAIDLPSLFGQSLGETQFKQLTVLAALGLVGTCGITCWAVTERVLLSTTSKSNDEGGLYQVASHIWTTIMHLPPRIRAICMAQFWAWIGWFPFLFYSTTWIGETYLRYDAPHDAKQSGDALGEVGRVGSKAFIIYSLITFFGSWFLPLVIKSPDDRSYTQRPPQSIRAVAEKFNKYKPDLLTAWMWAHATFAAAMLFAPFAKSFRFATVLVCLCGLPWNIASWAPHAFLGVEVNKLSSANGGSYRRLSDAELEMADMNGGLPRSSLLHLEHGPDDPHAMLKSGTTGELTGVYFGILNIYTTIPQFIGTVLSTIVFSVLEPGKSPELAHSAHPDEHHSTDGPNGVAVCLFIGALSAIAAVFATKKLKYV
ncbi:major facilitator superfamily domain-containing protein [Xylariaceae sp. AK1471]|nr:major facilitator superfamily domain-containing protein [Xylariaceae sp. AK1471]